LVSFFVISLRCVRFTSPSSANLTMADVSRGRPSYLRMSTAVVPWRSSSCEYGQSFVLGGGAGNSVRPWRIVLSAPLLPRTAAPRFGPRPIGASRLAIRASTKSRQMIPAPDNAVVVALDTRQAACGGLPGISVCAGMHRTSAIRGLRASSCWSGRDRRLCTFRSTVAMVWY